MYTIWGTLILLLLSLAYISTPFYDNCQCGRLKYNEQVSFKEWVPLHKSRQSGKIQTPQFETFFLTLLIVSRFGWEHHLHIKQALSLSVCVWMYQRRCASIFLTPYGSDVLHGPVIEQTSQLLQCQSICVEWKDFPLQWMTAYAILIRNRKSDAEKHLAQLCPPSSPPAAHKPWAVMTSRLARLKLMPIGLFYLD